MAPSKQEKKFLLELIDVYRSLPQLWNVKSDCYSDRNKKEMGYETLLQKFRDYYPEGTKEELKKKINSLRTSFRKELKKFKDSSRSGAGAEEIYEPSLWCFDALFFLIDTETPASSRSTIQSSEEGQNEEIGDDQEGTAIQERVDESTNLHTVPAQPAKRKKLAKFSNRQDELIGLACEHLQKPENEFLTLAKAWANDLSKMDPKQLLLAKKGINDIIFEGLCGNLHRQSVQINPIPQQTRCWTPSSDTSEYAPSPYGSNSNPPFSSTMVHHSDYRDAVPQQYPNMAARNCTPMSHSSVTDNSGNAVDGTIDAGKYFGNFNPNA